MATEPVGTSTHYAPFSAYTPPVGRLPVLGKIRAEVDRLRAEAANAFNMAVNRDAEQANNDAKTTAEIAALEARVTNETNQSVADVAYVTGKTANEATQTANDTTRTVNDTNRAVQEVLYSQSKVTNETALANEEVTASGIKSTNDTTRTQNDTSRTSAETAALSIKSQAEVRLLDQKTASELAQTSDTIPGTIGVDPSGSGTPRVIWTTSGAQGVIGNQRALFEKQMDGFDRDAEQKLAKIIMDSWSVRTTTGATDVLPDDAGIDDAEIKTILNAVRAGVNIPPAT